MEYFAEKTEILEILDTLPPERVHMVRWFTFVMKEPDVSGISGVFRDMQEHILNVFPGESEMDMDDEDDEDDGMTPEEATQEILDDPEFMEMIRRGEADIAAGRTVSWESLRWK